jgi:hypothetical protein
MIKKLLMGGAAALAISACAASAQATTILFNLSSPTGNITNTHTYGTAPLTIVAKGFNWAGGTADLYGKHAGGDENGLGLNNDPTGDHEIHYHSGYVQIDVQNLFGRILPGSLTFGTNSTTGGEQWTVYGSNQSGGTCGANPLCGVTALVSGTNEAINQAFPHFGTYRYYDFVETGTHGGKNFLITNIKAQSVPEPGAWALMLTGFGGLGAVLRRRRAGAALA